MAIPAYISTRADPASGRPSSLAEAIASGMPSDGGLYIPEFFPPLPARIFDPEPLSYEELALLVLEPFFGEWDRAVLAALVRGAYGSGLFDAAGTAPLTRLSWVGEGRFHLLELFHGPTAAFKDFALTLLGGLLRTSLDNLGAREPVLVLTATSGDTGSAALSGLGQVPGIRTAVFFPASGTSEIQRLQMVSRSGGNCFVAAIRGNFDDAQKAVKRVFTKVGKGEGLLAGRRLSSANSINIGRLLPQIVYYVSAWRSLRASGQLGADRRMHVAVPTGNFGDILAARYAKEMGLPIGKLVCASNANKVLSDFFSTGLYDSGRELVLTESPSMDILVSSNLERLLWLAAERSGAGTQASSRVAAMMRSLSGSARFELGPAERRELGDFLSGWCGDSSALATIATVWKEEGLLVDPHTATAIEVAQRLAGELLDDGPLVIAATASPFKFPRACMHALGLEGEVGGVGASRRVEVAARRTGVGAGGPAGTGARAGALSDLELSAKLARYTGLPVPRALAGLGAAADLDVPTLWPDDIEPALACFLEERDAAEGLG